MNKLTELIARYQSADTPRKQAGAKGQITKAINAMGRAAALEVLKTLENPPEWLVNRLDTKSFYREGGRIFGWWDAELQVQAEELPFEPSGKGGYFVSLYGDASGLWQQRGFHSDEGLQYVRLSGWGEDRLTVLFDVKKTFLFLQHGYALPCEIQWSRRSDGLYVDRSIIPEGFWCAYKWFRGCNLWYYEKHPEWFSDLDWWGKEELPRYSPSEEDDPYAPYAAVLGGK